MNISNIDPEEIFGCKLLSCEVKVFLVILFKCEMCIIYHLCENIGGVED
jgi:hypothetical protein